MHIAKVSPWGNSYMESFNGKLRDDLLNRELFLSEAKARLVIDRWRIDYNHQQAQQCIRASDPCGVCSPLQFFRSAYVLPAVQQRNNNPISLTERGT